MEFNRRLFLGGAAIAAGAAASSPAIAARSRAAGATKAQRQAMKALGAYADQHLADWGLPGMTVAVVARDGFEGYVHAGLADVARAVPVGPDHLFQIGSISKMFTALATWSLIEEGKLRPDLLLTEVFPEIKVRGGEAITLRHLLNHRAGLPADSELFPQGGLWTGFAPGTDWSYSNSGYALAGMIACQADGRLYEEMIAARVLDKIGMSQSRSAMRVADRARYAQGYEPALTDRLNPRPGAMSPSPWVDSDSPAGAIASTAGDMATFLRFLIGLTQGKGGPVFSDETAVRFLADPDDAPGWGGGKYGNGIARVEGNGRQYLNHTGGMVSFCSCLHVDIEAGVAAFASSNVHYSLNYRPRDVTLYACELMRALADGADAPTPKPTKPTLEAPQRYAGTFTSAAGDSFEIVAGADAVTLRRDGRVSAMQAAAPGLFATTDPDFAVTGVVVDIENDKAARAWIGEREYAADPAAGFLPPAPEALRKLGGRYDNDDRWAGPLYIYARAGGLFVGNIEPLERLDTGAKLEDAEWRLGGPASPERVRFGGFLSGTPQILWFSGTPYRRRFS